ncbi:autotransporter domain-containing protein [Rhizobium sp. G21]|uniref:autotransporter domain-containing protein n=1 Tax=Rhizobium sp. G21 TaxID=2758439 RepID=UPI0028ACACBC|nr:autotransporter domain-containing protein [Rhizobium sp. G21]
MTATGGVGAMTFSLASGDLPKGLTLNISTGDLTGPLEPDTEGDYSFVLRARDSRGNYGTGSYSIKVQPQIVTVTDKHLDVPAGSTPVDIPLHKQATGGPFVSAEKTFVEPENAGVATIIRGSFAEAKATAPVGWYLQFKPNPSYAGQVKVGFRLISALGISNTGTVTYNIALDKDEVAEEVTGLVEDFVRSRQSLLASTIKVPDLMKRRRLAATSEPVTTQVQPYTSGLTVNFSTSLAQIESARDLADGAIAGSPSTFDIWMSGAVLAHNNGENGDPWGSFAMISAGADYLVTEKLLLGLSFHYDRMTDPTDEDANLTGNGWLAGPYASVEIGKGVFWNANILYGGSVNDIDTEFWDGGFDTRRWLFDSSINGEWRLDEDTVLSPKLRAVYLSETVDDYAVDNAQDDTVNLEGFTTEQLQASIGAELSRDYHLENMVLTPSIGVTGGYAGLDGSGAFGQVAAGLSVNTETMLTFDFDLLFNFDDGGERSTGARAGRRQILTRRKPRRHRDRALWQQRAIKNYVLKPIAKQFARSSCFVGRFFSFSPIKAICAACRPGFDRAPMSGADRHGAGA